jgi:hypothetical protein
MRRSVLLTAIAVAAPLSVAHAQSRVLTAADYARAEKFLGFNTQPLVSNTGVQPSWLPDGRFTYRVRLPDGSQPVVLVNAKGVKTNCVAAPTLPVAITPVSPAPLPVNNPPVTLPVITALLADKLPDAVIVTAVTSARLCIVPTLIVVPVTLRLLRVASPDEFRVPTTLTPVPVTVITLAVPAEEMVTFPFTCGMFTLLVPFAMPAMPAVANN